MLLVRCFGYQHRDRMPRSRCACMQLPLLRKGCVCVTPVTRGFRKQGKDLENASRRAGGARDIASLAPTKTLAMICDGDGSWDANSCTCCRFCNGNGQGQSQEPRNRQVCSQAKGPFLGVETCTCVLQRAVCSGVARMTVMQMTR